MTTIAFRLSGDLLTPEPARCEGLLVEVGGRAFNATLSFPRIGVARGRTLTYEDDRGVTLRLRVLDCLAAGPGRSCLMAVVEAEPDGPLALLDAAEVEPVGCGDG
ncbi:MAG TPA: hypothetical protein VGH33_03830 [Isosphaeraceae bacterium]|jgi:hypothetical protein